MFSHQTTTLPMSTASTLSTTMSITPDYDSVSPRITPDEFMDIVFYDDEPDSEPTEPPPAVPEDVSEKTDQTEEKDGPEETFKVCAREILVQVKKSVLSSIPFLEAILSGTSFNNEESEEGVVIVDIDPYLLKICIFYAENYQYFSSRSCLLTKLSKQRDFSELLQLLDYLGVEPKIEFATDLSSLKCLEERLKDIKDGDPYECSMPGEEDNWAGRAEARNAAVELCVTLLMQRSGDISLPHRCIQKLQTDVLFVISHAATFGPRIRNHVWNASENIAQPSMKQAAKWVTEERLEFDCHSCLREKDEEREDGYPDDSFTDGEESPWDYDEEGINLDSD